MKKIGIDVGTSCVKIAVMDGEEICLVWKAEHRGKVLETLSAGMGALDLPEEAALRVTGGNAESVLRAAPGADRLEDIPAITEGARILAPSAGSVIEIGSQSSRYVCGLQEKAPRFSVNEHCAGGTGSFFEAQMSRLGMEIEDFNSLVRTAESIPNISGRCAVFAKTDIIHRQQEGARKQDILLGLCYAMVRNFKAVIVRGLPVAKPVLFCGGVSQNVGVRQAILSVFRLGADELLVPEHAVFVSAVGAAAGAERTVSVPLFIKSLREAVGKHARIPSLPPLALREGTDLSDPVPSGVLPAEGVFLGIDVGSTSTDLVLTDLGGGLVDFLYLRTAGDPEGAVRRGFSILREKYGEMRVRGVGVTGSGRERLGRMMGADAVRDEITAQAKAAVRFVPDADTVFEIGGQDSKFIRLSGGGVSDFQMNKICAAGTGAFVEEQAARMGIPIGDFGPLALTGSAPCDLGERCTVFIETAIAQAEAQGASPADVAAGVCCSVVENYLHKVVGGKPVGQRIVLQGGVCYNPAIVAAFQGAYGDRVTVSPVFSVSGSYGAALLAQEAVGDRESRFLGFDFPSAEKKTQVSDAEVERNRAFYRKAGQLVLEDYDSSINPKKKTIGVPLTLIIFKFFPMINAFFRNLGYNVILSSPSDAETVELSQKYACGETCYPVKLIYGHMMQLAEKKVDYIFLPSIRSIKHPHANAAHNYACPYMQTAARAVFGTLRLEERGIKLLSPVLDFDLGDQMMAKAMLQVGKSLGHPAPLCMLGLAKGAMAVRKYSSDVEGLGKELLSSLKPEDKVIVLVTRNYGITDPVLNMGIPEELLRRGHKVITLSHLPAMDLDISKEFPQMYWPFGDHILAGAKIIANHPNLYAVYLTNHGCGPDTVVAHLFREAMGDKPYLQIEVDEHYSKVGVVTRIEAFLDSISRRPPAPLPEGFDILNVPVRETTIAEAPVSGKRLLVPDLGYYTPYIVEYFRRLGADAAPMPKFTREVLALGRAEMNSKEYLPLAMLTGACLCAIGEAGGDEGLQFLITFGYGADADGQYARAVRSILDRRGFTRCTVVSPVLEEYSEKSPDFDLLVRALLTGDLVYALEPGRREKEAPERILSGEELVAFAKGCKAAGGKKIAAVGSPLCTLSLDEGVLETLESEGYRVMRAPLSELLQFLWRDNGKRSDFESLRKVREALGPDSFYAESPEDLAARAEPLGAYAGNSGRYRFAKASQMGERAAAVLAMEPRYENTAMALALRGQEDACRAPFLRVALDGDWDENAWSRLRSFLYYC